MFTFGPSVFGSVYLLARKLARDRDDSGELSLACQVWSVPDLRIGVKFIKTPDLLVRQPGSMLI